MAQGAIGNPSERRVKGVTQQGRATSLLSALQTVRRNHPDYSIDILSEGLDDLRTTARITGLSAPDAVKRLCKGLPVKVKTKGKRISVQMKKRKPQRSEMTLIGKVEDGFLKMPLPQAKVSICRADSSVIIDSVKNIINVYDSRKHKYSYYSVSVTTNAKTLLVHAQLKGYNDAWQRVYTDKSTDDGQIDVPTLQLRKMREIGLGEVEVKATRIKMFYRGDTIVYDATAFRLPEGSMLDDLIRQLPGVTINDQDEIFVNGRKVDELLLGSRSFFGGNKKVLMENLPYYTVKNLKVYEKQTDMSRAMGYDVEPRSYVMDVNLKNEYSQGYMGNVEAAGGTQDRWLSRGFLLGFTDRLRLTLLANANNVNESRHIGQSDQWTPSRFPQSLLTTRSVAGEIDYQSEDENVKETFRADYTSTSNEQTMRQHSERFLEGITPTSLTETFNRSGNRKLNLHNNLTLTKPLYLYVEADFNYAHRDGTFNSAFDEWDDSLTVSQRTVGMSEGRALSCYVETQGGVRLGKKNKALHIYAKVEHNNDESERANRYHTHVTTSSLQYNTNDIFNRSNWGVAMVGYSSEVAKDIHLDFTNNLFLREQHNRDYLYHPDTLLLSSQIDALTAITDLSNSYDSRNRDWSENLNVRLKRVAHYTHPDVRLPIDYDKWSLEVGFPVANERLQYQRGAIDTIARQTVFLPTANFQFRNVWKKSLRDLRFNLSFSQTRTLLLDRINIRDDSQPLVVKLGNPDLKPSAKSSFSISYYDRTLPKQGQCNASASFNYHHRDVAQSLTYNPSTGVYTYKPMNVSGAYDAHASLGMNQTIGEKRYWSWHANVGADYHHAVDHAMLAGMTASEENIVNTLSLNSGGNIRFNRKTLNIRAVAHMSWRHSNGRMYDFETLNAFDYNYGLEANYTTPALWGKKMGGLTFAADGSMYSRRGYGSSELNTDDFIVNASLSQPFMKGKFIVRLEAFDLLHNLSNTDYKVNALGRVETWYRSLPHYVMLHVVYRFNKQPKKK